jgi:hypothetical protein
MKRRQTALLLAAALILTACAQNDEPSPAEHARMMDLMRTIYGTEEGELLITSLRNQENPLRIERYRLNPVSMRALGDDRVALVANGILEENQNPDYGTAGSMSAYLLRKKDEKWTLERSFENKASMGHYGRLGKVSWIELGSGKPGFSIENTSVTPEGSSLRQISLFDLADPLMRNMSVYMRSLASDNEKECKAVSPECWNIKGKWYFEPKANQAYDDLVVDYGGYVETRPGNAPDSAPRTRSEVRSTLRYAYRRGEYVLVSGELPSVPGL